MSLFLHMHIFVVLYNRCYRTLDHSGETMVAMSLCDLVLQEDADMKTECGKVGVDNDQEDLVINYKIQVSDTTRDKPGV